MANIPPYTGSPDRSLSPATRASMEAVTQMMQPEPPRVRPAPAESAVGIELPIPADASPELLALRHRQQAVLEAMMVGFGIAASARAARVSRSTVYHWMKVDEAFQSAVAAWQAHARLSARGILHSIAEEAANVVTQLVRQGDLKAATLVLRGAGLLTPPPESRPAAGETGRSAARTLRQVASPKQLHEMLLSLLEEMPEPQPSLPAPAVKPPEPAEGNRTPVG